MLGSKANIQFIGFQLDHFIIRNYKFKKTRVRTKRLAEYKGGIFFSLRKNFLLIN